MIKTMITYRGDAEVAAKEIKPIISAALGFAIEYRHRHQLRRHFERVAASRYHYKRRGWKYVQRKQRVNGHNNPLMWTGDMKQQVLRRLEVRTLKTRARASGRMKGPAYLHMRPKGNHPPMADELNKDTQAELRRLAQLVDRRSTRAINALKTARSTKIA